MLKINFQKDLSGKVVEINTHKSKKNLVQTKSSLFVITFLERSLFHSVRGEAVSFKSPFPPNYPEIADRILEKDDNYNKLFGFLPIAPVSRLINVLPGLFVVFGIFGTFIGISMALPEIAKMDFNNLDGAGEILTSFVLAVTYAMKTSIAGILYSLIMTVLNTIAPIKALRDKTDKQFASCLENIWMAIHEKGNEEEQAIELLKKIHHSLCEVTFSQKQEDENNHIRRELAHVSD